MAHLQFVDFSIREYLLFRGFSQTLKAFETEAKSTEKSFSVEKIMERISHSIATQDLQSLRELWMNLSSFFFSKLDQLYGQAVKRIEANLFKLFLVTAHANNKPEKVNEFFVKCPELQTQAEWKDWFVFPFCKAPEDHPVYSVYFSKQWQDTLMISLHNFLATIFQCMPLPTLARIDSEATLIHRLQEENSALRDRIEVLQSIAGSPSGQSTSSSTSSHQSRLSTFNEQATGAGASSQQQLQRPLSGRHSSKQISLDDIVPYSIPAQKHLVDDFSTIAQESLQMGHVADSQLRGLKYLIRNIGGQSPTMHRKQEAVSSDRNKKRSGSAGPRSWMAKD